MFYHNYLIWVVQILLLGLCGTSKENMSLYISNQLDVTISKLFHFVFATLHVSGVSCPSLGGSLLHW
jgi:hypothetical protein